MVINKNSYDTSEHTGTPFNRHRYTYLPRKKDKTLIVSNLKVLNTHKKTEPCNYARTNITSEKLCGK